MHPVVQHRNPVESGDAGDVDQLLDVSADPAVHLDHEIGAARHHRAPSVSIARASLTVAGAA